jgi:hypothetical protein
MYKSLGSKLPLLLTYCLFTNFLPASASTLCPSNSPEHSWKIARDFDRDGSNGSNGRAGRDGRDGANQSVYADGSPVNLDLSGKDGEEGENGRRGSRPDCNYQPENVNSNVYAPSGGSGGDGGRGGNGGNGGSLTVYYSNLADLKKIAVRANGGNGGRGGRGARGAVGCNCRRKSWQVRTCRGTPGSADYKCTETTYRCYDGSDGRDGRDGQDGKQGRLGVLSLVKGQQPLTEDKPTLQLPVSELAGRQFELSKNQWQQRQGATALLAIGSVIDDEYREFVGRLEGTFKIVWQDTQPLGSLVNQIATLTLNDNQQVEIDFPEDLWVNGTTKTEGKRTEFTVNNATLKQDVTRLAVAEFAEAGQNLNLKVVDLAGKSHFLNTQFRLKYRVQDSFSGSFDYQTVYDGEIPAGLVSRDNNRFTLNLGKLKMPSDALTSGTNVEIELVAIRSLGDRSAQQTLNWRGTIRRAR